MKFLLSNRNLSIAFGISLLAHAALLSVRFATPDTFRLKPADPGLEVILVNAKHDKKPLHADALAQANLDGGGHASSGRAKSPLPNLHRSEDGDHAETAKTAKQRVKELEEQQRQLIAQLNKNKRHNTLLTANPDKRKELAPQPDGTDLLDNAKAIARREAEIAKNIEDYNKRPKKTQISPSTKEVGYAMYYDAVKQRIEKIGTLNFPQKDGKKLYGELIVSIPIFQDGTIYEKDAGGGLSVERSSGNPALDEAAIRIVRRSAPFGRFPQNMRSTGKDDVWVITTRFKFTREDAVEAETRGER